MAIILAGVGSSLRYEWRVARGTKTDSPAETVRVSDPAVNVMLPDVIAKSSSSAKCLCGGGPPPEPTTQSSANIEPPDSSPVTRNVYMSPGPQNDRPVCPDATWITRLVNSFIVGFSFVASRSCDRASRVPPPQDPPAGVSPGTAHTSANRPLRERPA